MTMNPPGRSRTGRESGRSRNLDRGAEPAWPGWAAAGARVRLMAASERIQVRAASLGEHTNTDARRLDAFGGLDGGGYGRPQRGPGIGPDQEAAAGAQLIDRQRVGGRAEGPPPPGVAAPHAPAGERSLDRPHDA